MQQASPWHSSLKLLVKILGLKSEEKRGSALQESAAEDELDTIAIRDYWQQLALIHFY